MIKAPVVSLSNRWPTCASELYSLAMRKIAGAKTTFRSSNVAMPDGLLMTIKSSFSKSITNEQILKMYPNDKITYDKYLEETQNDCDVC